MGKSGIKIKPSKVGSLRSAMHAKKGSKLSVSAMQKKLHSKGTTAAMKKKLVFALNARKWKHEDGGLVEQMSFGGFIKKAFQGIGNAAAFTLDQTLSGIGLGNVVGENWYSSDKAAGKAEGIIDKINPIKNLVANVIVPGSGKLTEALQQNNTDKSTADLLAEQNLQNATNLRNQNNQVFANQGGGNQFAPTFADGGKVPPGMTGMMKARMAYADAFGNKAGKRMVSPNPKTGMTPEGLGTHYMASYDNYAIPKLQDTGNKSLEYYPGKPPLKEAMKFESEEEARYFAEHYKDIAPMMRNQKYPYGGLIPNGQPNVELEKQEVSQAPDGSMKKFNLPSHANATSDNQMAMEPGTRIFSDKLGYAAEADKIRKQIEKYEQILYS